jgi:bifunctional non-homologous end joining protein LigD
MALKKGNKFSRSRSLSVLAANNKRKSAMPSRVSPMLCTLTKVPPVDHSYIYEIKWDGYRIIAYVNGANVRMDSRSGLDYTNKYPPIAQALKALKHKVILDGEVVVFNKEGFPDFDALQKYNGHDTPIHYRVFDILWLDGHDLKDLSLIQRKKVLSELVAGNDLLRVSESFDDGHSLYEQSLKSNLEGIIAKKKDSTYNEGERANNWLKIPTRKRQEFVIGGWAESERGRSFRSLLFGAYKDGKLEWIGRSGGGYKEKEMPDILERLKKLEVEKSPFINTILDTKGAVIHYVKPQLVANFEFATWTKNGRIRKPATFLGFRKDKKAKDVVREIPKSLEIVDEEIERDQPTENRAIRKRQTRSITSKDSNWRVLEKVKPNAVENFDLGNCTIPMYDVDREVWKGIPKARLIEYYHSIARYILPYLKDRPLSLHITPNGAMAAGIYIKDMEGRQPDCAEIFTDKRRHPKPGKRKEIDYLVCNNEATLLYLINLGCIDVNPWMSTRHNPGQPDFINLDLDPTDDDFQKVIETALSAKEVLAKYKLKSFVKTSGKTGIHIFIPVMELSFAEARVCSERLGEAIQQLVPDISTTKISKELRGNKVLIDPSQNDYSDTLASAYSVRPNKIPAVSTPLSWQEVNKRLDPNNFTIDTIQRRLNQKGDLFEGLLEVPAKQKNTKILKKLFL